MNSFEYLYDQASKKHDFGARHCFIYLIRIAQFIIIKNESNVFHVKGRFLPTDTQKCDSNSNST